MAPKHWRSSPSFLIPFGATVVTLEFIFFYHQGVPALLLVGSVIFAIISAFAIVCVLRRMYPLCLFGADEFQERAAARRALMGSVEMLDEDLELGGGTVKYLQDFAADVAYFGENARNMMPKGPPTQEFGKIMEGMKNTHADLTAVYYIVDEAVSSPALVTPGPQPLATDNSPRLQEKNGTECPRCHSRHHKDGM
ncbi:uncharacterized protein DNG_01759 [Cephalotrichum gorgonifer]|uniref:Uncharacterized protein n=1 Tax=Cephalotrichum gorgonifer TaxID=2041049 RepID=A0AAE8MS67_9PEZI|nr:uncharacterized protein DNG_01759 [Cephalotrichum gorgonifer]